MVAPTFFRWNLCPPFSFRATDGRPYFFSVEPMPAVFVFWRPMTAPTFCFLGGTYARRFYIRAADDRLLRLLYLILRNTPTKRPYRLFCDSCFICFYYRRGDHWSPVIKQLGYSIYRNNFYIFCRFRKDKDRYDREDLRVYPPDGARFRRCRPLR